MSFLIRKPPISRRTVLRGAIGGAAVALALPPLEAMFAEEARAADPSSDPIFGLFYWANGVPWHAGQRPRSRSANSPGGDVWTPPTIGADFTPSPLLTPLAAHKVSVATGLEPKTEVPQPDNGQSDGHMRGFMVAMTGDRIRPEGFDHPSHTLTCLRPTLDQYVATHEQFYGNTPSRFLLAVPRRQRGPLPRLRPLERDLVHRPRLAGGRDPQPPRSSTRCCSTCRPT